jgi:hypothetical protein
MAVNIASAALLIGIFWLQSGWLADDLFATHG